MGESYAYITEFTSNNFSVYRKKSLQKGGSKLCYKEGNFKLI